jgi:hypothetical protein
MAAIPSYVRCARKSSATIVNWRDLLLFLRRAAFDHREPTQHPANSIARERAPPLVARSLVPVSAETIRALHRHGLVQLPMGAARGGGAPPASGTTGSVASTGGGVSAGRNRGASGVAGSLASSVFLVRSEEGAPEGTLLRSVVGTFESDPSPAHAKDGVATAIPTRIASIASIRFMIIPPLAPEERFRWMSYITP